MHLLHLSGIENTALVFSSEINRYALRFWVIFNIYSFPSGYITGDWIEFLVLYSRTSSLSHCTCNNFHLLTPIPSPATSLPPPLGKMSVLYVCESLSGS